VIDSAVLNQSGLLPAGDPVDPRSSYRGCLLGGAVGDALGAGVEFLSAAEIRRRFGPGGLRDYVTVYGRRGAITDDTQMTLFTAEGLIRGLMRQRAGHGTDYTDVTGWAYQRWLLTQGDHNLHGLSPLEPAPGWLWGIRALHSPRAPGNTCLSALRHAREAGLAAVNDSKGCGGVMRMAPAGLFVDTAEDAFDLGCELSALTHGHPSGWLAGGAFAALIRLLLDGETLEDALDPVSDMLAQRFESEEVLAALQFAADLAISEELPGEAIRQLGQGWVAEEALAIAVYCALVAPDFREGVLMAVNHDGDSDSTGAIAGNLLGLILGEGAIPESWLAELELREVITQVANDLFDCANWDLQQADHAVQQALQERYPAW